GLVLLPGGDADIDGYYHSAPPPEKGLGMGSTFTAPRKTVNMFSMAVRTPIRVHLRYETPVLFITVPDVLFVDND
ncbi:MAG: hypothetical protein J6W53_00720, partial [Candidatus Methanomethylophilaceae archaeon]|nr:hypothetical protein [Candidatus Methanomethylophilaceae archaeon]